MVKSVVTRDTSGESLSGAVLGSVIGAILFLGPCILDARWRLHMNRAALGTAEVAFVA